MDDTARPSLLRQPDDSFDSTEPTLRNYIPNGRISTDGDGCCRLCCSDDCDLRELFPGGYKEELLLRKIFDCTTVQISHSEDSDALICFACVGKIEEFFQYREQCRTNDVLQRKWKKRLGRSGVARTTSTMLPVVTVKSEPQDSEYFGPSELVPLDTRSIINVESRAVDESYGNSFSQAEQSLMNIDSGEDHNLLELLPPEHSYESYCAKDRIAKYEDRSEENEDDGEYQMHIKQEPEDIDDSFGWGGLDETDQTFNNTSVNTALIPVIEDSSVVNGESLEFPSSRPSLEFEEARPPSQDVGNMPTVHYDEPRQTMATAGQTNPSTARHVDYKIVKNAQNRTRLLAGGNMFVRDSTRQDGTVVWRCRKNYDRCGVTAEEHPNGTVDVIGVHNHDTSIQIDRKHDSRATYAYKFRPTAKGNKMLIAEGYRYAKFYLRANGTSLWRCANAPQCKVKATLEEDGMVYVKHNDVHNHDKSEPPVSATDTEHNRWLNENNARKGIPHAGTDLKEESAETKGHSNKPRAIVQVRTSPQVRSAQRSVSVKKKKVMDYRIVKNKKGFQALVHKGYRYCKVRVRQDGSIKWLCKMNRKTCNAGLYQFSDGHLEWVNAVRHNHEPTNADDEEEQPPVESEWKDKNVANKYHIDEDTFVGSEWYFVRNKKNGTTLVHASYRYNKKGDRSDKSSLWRCSRTASGCRAAIVMYPNETIAKLDNIDHNHAPPSPETGDQPIDDSEITQSVDDVSNAADVSHEVSDQKSSTVPTVASDGLMEEQDDPEANLRTLLNFTLGVSADDSVDGTNSTVVSQAEAGYRFIQNRRFTQSLLFRGYRYCRNNPRIDGSVLYVCQMNKKTCKATVKMMPDGSLVLINLKHNHSRLEEDMEEGFDDDEEVASATSAVNVSHNSSLGGKADRSSAPTYGSNGGDVISDMEQNTGDSRKNTKHGYYYAMNRSNRECLIFQQCRYSKSATHADGSVVWRCMMAGGMCYATVVVHADGSCISNRDFEHNHPPLTVIPTAVRYPDANKVGHETGRNHREDGADDGTSGSVGPPRRNSFPGHDGTFQLYKTARGQLTLIHDGYRYSLRNRQTGGTTSWKCRANKLCGAGFYISKTGTMLATEERKLSHNHEQNAQTMHWADPIQGENVSNFDELVQQCFSKMQAEQSGKSRQPGTHAKIIKYGGHTYTLRNVKPSGREYWRCSLFQTKACRAALFCRDGGKVVEHTNALPHTHKPVIVHRTLPIRLRTSSPPKNATTTGVSERESSLPASPEEGGSRDFIMVGRNNKTIVHRGHRYYWNHQNRDGSTFFRCVRHNNEGCTVTIRMDAKQKKIFNHSRTEHNHHMKDESPDAEAVSLDANKPPLSSPKKREMLLMLKAGPPLTNFHFERSSRGTTLCHNGYKYWSHNKLSCGWTVYRCRMQKFRCLAAGYYNPRAGVFHLRQDVAHTHAATQTVADAEEEPTQLPAVQLIKSDHGPKALVEQMAAGDVSNSGDEATFGEFSFVRAKKDGKISLYCNGSLYTFGGKKETADGEPSYQYQCFHVQCTASVELLPSGLVRAVRSEHQRHSRPCLENMEDLGRGSKDFRLLETNAGTPVLAFQGHRYYGNNYHRTREDGSSRWYCQSTVAYEKRDNKTVRRRCFVPLSMLPNGSVSSSGKHMHPICRALDDHLSYMTVDGQRFQLKRKLPDQSSIWRCAENPACGAHVYRLKDGKVQTTRTAHCHGGKVSGTPRLRLLNGATVMASEPARPAPVKLSDRVTPSEQGSIPPTSIVPSMSMTQFEKTFGRRSFWYGGNRFYFYHTRSDGKQYWRCSLRTNDCKCRAGLLRMANGLIVPHNNEHHSHPDQTTGKTDYSIPEPPGLIDAKQLDTKPHAKAMKGRTAKLKTGMKEEELQLDDLSVPEETQHVHEPPEIEPDVESEGKQGSYDYKIVRGVHRSDTFLEQNGVIYSYRNKRIDGGRIYCCKLKSCNFKKLLMRSGRLVSMTLGRHSCEETNSTSKRKDNNTFEASATVAVGNKMRVVETLSTSVTSAGNEPDSFMFRCKTSVEDREIEDPDDFLLNDNSIVDAGDILPPAKRLRLTLHPEPMEEAADDGDEEPAAVTETDSDGTTLLNQPDDAEVIADSSKLGTEEDDPASSAWFDVEQEEIVESSGSEYDNVEDVSLSKSSSATSGDKPPHGGTVEIEVREGTRTSLLEPTKVNKEANDEPAVNNEPAANPQSHINADDESNDGSVCHTKCSTKELVVSAVPHESYTRKVSDKIDDNDADDDVATAASSSGHVVQQA